MEGIAAVMEFDALMRTWSVLVGEAGRCMRRPDSRRWCPSYVLTLHYGRHAETETGHACPRGTRARRACVRHGHDTASGRPQAA